MIRQTLIAAVALLGVALASPACLAQLHKWKDAEGRTHYSNVPVLGQSAPAAVPHDRVGTASAPAAAPAAPAAPATQPAAASAKAAVTLYTTVWCGYCSKTRAYLKARGIPFTDRDIEKSAEAQSDYRRLGGRGVPVILVGSQRMDGFSEGRLAELLKRGGY
jgi:glutaredoxin